jgi:hypothetical protein
MCIRDSYVYWGQLCLLGTTMCIRYSYVYKIGGLCFLFVKVMSDQLADIILSVIIIIIIIIFSFLLLPEISKLAPCEVRKTVI